LNGFSDCASCSTRGRGSFDRSTVRPFDCVGGGTWTAAHQGTSGWLLGVFTGDGSRDLMRTTTAGTDVLI